VLLESELETWRQQQTAAIKNAGLVQQEEQVREPYPVVVLEHAAAWSLAAALLCTLHSQCCMQHCANEVPGQQPASGLWHSL
jgi:hypothetical protein